MIEKAVSLDDLSDELALVHAYWRERGGEELRCRWSEFHLEELPPGLLPTTLVVDVKDDVAENCFRFWGSGMHHIHGGDMTGKTTAELEPPEFRDAVRRSHARMVEVPKAYGTRYGFDRHGGFDHLQTALRLPLSDDGHAVHQIVVVIEWTPAGKEIKAKRPTTNHF